MEHFKAVKLRLNITHNNKPNIIYNLARSHELWPQNMISNLQNEEKIDLFRKVYRPRFRYYNWREFKNIHNEVVKKKKKNQLCLDEKWIKFLELSF